jgi:hypothetical protein
MSPCKVAGESIHNSYARILLSVIKIFGVNGVTSQGLCGRKDGRVPIRDRVACRLLNGDPYQAMIDWVTRECGQLLNPLQRLLG